MALRDCILTAPMFTETIGVYISRSFCHRVKSHKIQRLHSTVFHCWDTQRAFFSILLRNLHTAQRHRLIPTTLECVDSFGFGCIGRPFYAVNSSSVLAFICSNPNYGKITTVERVGQQPLQGFNLAVLAFPLSLYNTCLQLPNIVLSLATVNPLLTLGVSKDYIFRCTRFFRFVHLLSFL